MNKIKSFRDLNIWKKGIEIAEKTYQFTSELPKDEQFGLISQMRRAAISLPSNAAEGFRRRSNREFRQFLHIALGSASELETHIELCKNLYGLRSDDAKELLDLLNHFQAMVMTLIKELHV